MYIDALTLSLLLVVFVIAITVVVSYIRVPRVIDEAGYRDGLQRVIKSLRLNKMLVLLNIPLEQYIASVPLAEIKSHVLACRACTESGACDRCLRRGVLDRNMRFCPNHESLLRHQKLLSTV